MTLGIGRSLDTGLALGRKLVAAGAYSKAVQCHRLIALRFPLEAKVYMALGQSLRARGDVERMRRAFHRALLLKPDASEIYFNFGNAERNHENPDQARNDYRRALIIAPTEPNFTTGLAFALLELECWHDAWSLYETRDSCVRFSEALERTDQKIWDGSIRPGERILVVCEQGRGDSILFVRYAKSLADAGMKVYVHCQPELKRQFSSVPWITGVSTITQPEVDWNILTLSLPHRFDTKPETIPSPVPYLKVTGNKDRKNQRKYSKVGLVWTGSIENKRNDLRSVPRKAFTNILGVEGIKFQSLQFGWKKDNADKGGPWGIVAELGDLIEDYADTAKIIAKQDLTISVCTSVAHLAGALGKPIWLLLGRQPYWLWLQTGSATAWYPTMTIHRLADGEEWEDLLDRVAEKLDQYVQRNRSA